MKRKCNRKCTKVCLEEEEEGQISIQVAFVCRRATLIKHVVVVFFLVLRLVEVLHLLFGAAWPVAGQSAQAAHAVAVVLVV